MGALLLEVRGCIAAKLLRARFYREAAGFCCKRGLVTRLNDRIRSVCWHVLKSWHNVVRQWVIQEERLVRLRRALKFAMNLFRLYKTRESRVAMLTRKLWKKKKATCHGGKMKSVQSLYVVAY